MLSALPLVEQPLPAWVCASFWASYVAGRAAVNKPKHDGWTPLIKAAEKFGSMAFNLLFGDKQGYVQGLDSLLGPRQY